MKLAEILKPEMAAGRFWTHSKTLVEGCTKVSPGCENCWSEAMARRFGGMVDESREFDGTIKEHLERMDDILPKSNRRKQRVWTYWNDLFHPGVSYGFRDKLFGLITWSNDYHIICTKRPEIAVRYLSAEYHPLVKPNVIILVTMENQEMADKRLPYAAEISSMGWHVGSLVEPMLTPVDLTGEWGACLHGNGPLRKRWSDALCWIIAGPENGKGKRPFDGQWAMRLQAQAKAVDVPFFYKAGFLNGKSYQEAPDL